MTITVTANDRHINLHNNCHKSVKPGKLYQLLRRSHTSKQTEVWDDDIGVVMEYQNINCEIFEGIKILSLAPDGIFMLIEATTTAVGIHYVDDYEGPLDPVFHILTPEGKGWLSFSQYNICADGFYLREVKQ